MSLQPETPADAERTVAAPLQPPLRVLTIIDSLAIGGAEHSLATIAPYLIERGIDLHVAYLTERPGIGPDLEESGVTLHALGGAGGRAGNGMRTVRLLRSLRPDLVHTTLFDSDIVGRAAASVVRIPVVSSFVTESYGPEHVHNPEYQWWKVRAAQAADAATARLVARFHAVSASSRKLMAARLRLPETSIDVIHRGRDPERLGVRTAERRRAVREELGIGDRDPLVVAAARHYHMKGLDVLVEAFADVLTEAPTGRLLIAGREGPATAELKRIVARHNMGDSVIFVGFRDDLSDLMAAADVFVLPSRAEGSPGVLIEAMALCVPIVATDIPSVREIAVEHPPVAILVPVEDTRAMGDGILRLLEEPERAAALAAGARRRFLKRYTMTSIADQTVAFYRRALGDDTVRSRIADPT